MREGDRGGLYVAFSVNKKKRMVFMDFGTVVSWIAAPKDEALAVANGMRIFVIRHFGMLPYNKAELPIRVVVNKENGSIESHLPMEMGVLGANPELFLAWAEVTETVAKQLP
jgi:hypothetical protein